MKEYILFKMQRQTAEYLIMHYKKAIETGDYRAFETYPFNKLFQDLRKVLDNNQRRHGVMRR